MREGSIRVNLLLGLPALALVLVLGAGTAARSPAFLSDANLANLAARLLPLGIVSLGQSIVLMAGRIDLSAGSVMSLATAVMALASPTLGWPAILAALSVGPAAGLLTAAGVTLLEINPLVMSLATAALVKGATLLLLPSPGGEVDYGLYSLLFEGDRLLGAPLLLVLAAFLLAFLALGWTRWGRTVYACGSDPRAAFANGAPLRRIDLSVFVISGLSAAAAGVFLSVYILSGDPLIGEPYTLDSVSASILGGVALKGGRGSVLGVLLAAVALVLLNNAFNLLELDTNLQAVAKGLTFVVALLVFRRGEAGEH